MAQAARNGLDVDTGANSLGRVRVPEPIKLGEVTPTPCRQHNWMHGRTIFVRHDGMMVGKLDAKGEQLFCHDETMLAQLSRENGRW
jgi:hypothetical protein